MAITVTGRVVITWDSQDELDLALTSLGAQPGNTLVSRDDSAKTVVVDLDSSG